MPEYRGEIAAIRPGKCQCCYTPYEAGAKLRMEFGKWVLIDHDMPEQPRTQRPGLRDQFLMGRKNQA